MIEAILALGLVITTATQLRAGGLPLGPGEMLLLVWLCLAGLRQILSRPLIVNPALWRVIMFWCVFVVSLSVGMINGLIIEPFQDYQGIFRDTFAYALMLAISIMMAISLTDEAERRKVVWCIVLFGAMSLVLQIADGLGAIPLPGVEPWYWDRFRGWAENPNQLGLFALGVVLLSLHLADKASSKLQIALAYAAAAPALVAGFMSRSDSFVIGLIVSVALFVTLKSIGWLRDTEMAPTLRGAAVVLGLLALPLAGIVSVPFASAALKNFESISNQVYNDNDQGETRLTLWAEAIDKGLESGLMGFGPGPHLTAKSFKRPPPDKFEVHNTLLDLLTQGGMVAIAAFVWISGAALFAAVRTNNPGLAALIVGLLVFSMFHYLLRHPLFWLGIVLCLHELARSYELLPSARRHGTKPDRLMGETRTAFTPNQVDPNPVKILNGN